MTTAADAILNATHSIVKAELESNAEALEPYISDDYVGIDPSGAIISKEISLDRYRNKDFKLSELELRDITVEVYGDIGYERGTMIMEGHLGTFEFGGRYRYTHLWRRLNGYWKVSASQLTPIIREEPRAA